MFKWSLVVSGLLALVSAAGAEPNNTQSTPLKLDCGQFERLPNGYWVSGPNATINGNGFGNNIFGPHSIRLNGVDVTDALTKQCSGERS
jgi:hypothetical protein